MFTKLRNAKILALSLMALVVLFFSCDKSPMNSSSEVDTQVWTISGLVYDAINLQPMKDCKIMYGNEGSFSEVKTNDKGYYSIEGLTAGKHTITIEKDSFATTKIIATSMADSVIKVWLDQEKNIAMYKKDATISGKAYLFKSDSGVAGTRTLAKGAVVWFVPSAVSANQYLISAICSTVVDSVGEFTLKNLPRISGSLEFESYFSNGIQYNASSVAIVPAILTKVPDVDFTVNSNFVVKMLSTNVTRAYFTADTIKLTFSDSIIASTIMAKLDTNGTEVNAFYSWSADGKTINVLPVKKLVTGKTYTLTISGKAANDKILNLTNFHVVTAPGAFITSTNLWDNVGNPVRNFKQTDTITLTYSEALDTTTKALSVTLTSALVGAPNVLTETKWSNGGKTLKIIPLEAMPANTEITLNITNAVSVRGAAITNPALKFTTIGGISIASVNFLSATGADGVNFALTGSVTINFSAPVDTAKVLYNSTNGKLLFITFRESVLLNEVPFDRTWSNGNKTLKLTPRTELKNKQTKYDVVINTNLPSVYPANTLGTTITKSFTTVIGMSKPGKVASLSLSADLVAGTLNFATNYANADIAGAVGVVFTELDSVDSYDVYARGTVRKTNWTIIKSNIASTGKAGANISTSIAATAFDIYNNVTGDVLSGGNKVQLVVVPKVASAIDTLVGDFSVDTISFADVYAVGDSLTSTVFPVTVSGLTTNLLAGTWNETTEAAEAVTGNLVFPEDMDMSLEPTFTVTQNAAPGKVTVTGYWSTSKIYTVVVTQPKEISCSANTIVVAIKNCKDSSGNGANNTYTNSVTTITLP